MKKAKSLQEKEKNTTNILENKKDTGFYSPEIQSNLNRSNIENTLKKKKLVKVRSKSLKNEISDILEYFSELIKIETKYGEMMMEVGTPKFFNQSIIFIEDHSEKFYNFTEFPLKSKNLLMKFANDRSITKFSLPEWSVFRNGVKIIGKAHKDCASFIKKGVNDMVFMFNHEYLSESLKMKKEKKEIKISFEKISAYLTKVSKEYKEQHETYKKQYSIYEDSKGRKEAPTLLYKKENEMKISSYNLGII